MITVTNKTFALKPLLFAMTAFALTACGGGGSSQLNDEVESALAAQENNTATSDTENNSANQSVEQLKNIYKTRATEPGSQCLFGGIELFSGFDLNGNGSLESSEVSKTYQVCHGAPGSNGQDGTNGQNGQNGQNGTNGVNGVGIQSVSIKKVGNVDHLFIRFTNGTETDIGALTVSSTAQANAGSPDFPAVKNMVAGMKTWLNNLETVQTAAEEQAKATEDLAKLYGEEMTQAIQSLLLGIQASMQAFEHEQINKTDFSDLMSEHSALVTSMTGQVNYDAANNQITTQPFSITVMGVTSNVNLGNVAVPSKTSMSDNFKLEFNNVSVSNSKADISIPKLAVEVQFDAVVDPAQSQIDTAREATITLHLADPEADPLQEMIFSNKPEAGKEAEKLTFKGALKLEATVYKTGIFTGEEELSQGLFDKARFKGAVERVNQPMVNLDVDFAMLNANQYRVSKTLDPWLSNISDEGTLADFLKIRVEDSFDRYGGYHSYGFKLFDYASVETIPMQTLERMSLLKDLKAFLINPSADKPMNITNSESFTHPQLGTVNYSNYGFGYETYSWALNATVGTDNYHINVSYNDYDGSSIYLDDMFVSITKNTMAEPSYSFVAKNKLEDATFVNVDGYDFDLQDTSKATKKAFVNYFTPGFNQSSSYVNVHFNTQNGAVIAEPYKEVVSAISYSTEGNEKSSRVTCPTAAGCSTNYGSKNENVILGIDDNLDKQIDFYLAISTHSVSPHLDEYLDAMNHHSSYGMVTNSFEEAKKFVFSANNQHSVLRGVTHNLNQISDAQTLLHLSGGGGNGVHYHGMLDVDLVNIPNMPGNTAFDLQLKEVNLNLGEMLSYEFNPQYLANIRLKLNGLKDAQNQPLGETALDITTFSNGILNGSRNLNVTLHYDQKRFGVDYKLRNLFDASGNTILGSRGFSFTDQNGGLITFKDAQYESRNECVSHYYDYGTNQMACNRWQEDVDYGNVKKADIYYNGIKHGYIANYNGRYFVSYRDGSEEALTD